MAIVKVAVNSLINTDHVINAQVNDSVLNIRLVDDTTLGFTYMDEESALKIFERICNHHNSPERFKP